MLNGSLWFLGTRMVQLSKLSKNVNLGPRNYSSLSQFRSIVCNLLQHCYIWPIFILDNSVSFNMLLLYSQQQILLNWTLFRLWQTLLNFNSSATGSLSFESWVYIFDVESAPMFKGTVEVSLYESDMFRTPMGLLQLVLRLLLEVCIFWKITIQMNQDTEHSSPMEDQVLAEE